MSPPKRTILITGCSSGIGQACALGLHHRGYQVFATARRLETLAPLQAMGIQTLALDVCQDASIQQALAQILKQTQGRLDALFNNAGYGQFGALEDLHRAHLQAQFETNVFGPMMLINALLPIFRRQGWGRIIQNSSILGIVTRPFSGAYNASKFALEGFSDTLRLELHGSNIHVCLIEPGPIRSQFRKNGLEQILSIDYQNSPHKAAYERALHPEFSQRMHTLPFMQGPEAVLKVLIHALESKNPKTRYPVTFYGHLFTHLKRFLPTRILDRLLRLA